MNLPILDTSVIPEGPYCYKRIYQVDAYGKMTWEGDSLIPPAKVCPYYIRSTDPDDTLIGSCAYLNEQDRIEIGAENVKDIVPWDIWDMVKECGINNDWEDES